jgi:phage baseplate assembly protein W
MEQHKEFLGRGWAFPVQLDPVTGRVAAVEYEDDIRQAIQIILDTSPGERVMRPDFGCGIHDMVFGSMDTTTLQRIRSLVLDALTRYEARIEINNVTVLTSTTEFGRLDIELEYRVRRTNQLGNYVYPFYFREGGRP